MDNIQLCYIDNEINKIDKMKQGDVIYKNGMELLVVLSYDHEEPCRGCFFYKDKKCGSERLIKCWNCNKEYIFTVIRENKRKAYHLSDEGFEEYKKFLSDPDQKKFCFKGYYYVEVKEQDDKELLGAMGRVVYK